MLSGCHVRCSGAGGHTLGHYLRFLTPRKKPRRCRQHQRCTNQSSYLEKQRDHERGVGVEERNICFHWRVPPLAGRHFDSVYCHKSINHGVHSLSMGVCSQESGQCHKQLKVVTE